MESVDGVPVKDGAENTKPQKTCFERGRQSQAECSKTGGGHKIEWESGEKVYEWWLSR